ncbi:MAG: ATP-binding protein [Proteobacteria bacterium]|nr:ATP-binding protein [Pseudomonadota bacterium]
MSPRSFLMKLVGALALLLFGISGYLTFYLSQRLESLAIGGVRNKATHVTHMIALGAAVGLEYGDKVHVRDFVATVASDPDLLFVRVLDANGDVFVSRGEVVDGVAGILRPSDNGISTEVVKSALYVGAPIVSQGGDRIGRAQMGFSLARIDAELVRGRRVIVVVFLATLIVCAVAVVLALWFEKARARAFSELERHNRDMRLVMDNVDQGLLTLLPDGTMAPERSAVVDAFFGPAPPGTAFVELLARVDADVAGVFDILWQQLYDDLLPVDIALGELPKQLSTDRNTLTLEYKPIVVDGELSRILVVITDITSIIDGQRAEASQRDLLSALDKYAADERGFLEFFSEAELLVGLVSTGIDPAEVDRRRIHTLKGNCSFFGISTVADCCHHIEDEIARAGGTVTKALRELLASTWDDFASKIGGLVAGGSMSVVVDVSDHMELLQAIEAGRPYEELSAMARTWIQEPLERTLGRVGEQATALGRRLGLGDIRVDIAVGDIRLHPKRWASFWSAFGHAIRNCLDHGLEPPVERARAGKPSPGRLLLEGLIDGEHLVIRLSDDGRGIDWAAIADRAQASGLPAETRQDLIAALFTDGLTTRATVSAISGRGVGMGALKQACTDLDGTIEIHSEHRRGTTFEFRFPHREAGQDWNRNRLRRAA